MSNYWQTNKEIGSTQAEHSKPLRIYLGIFLMGVGLLILILSRT